MTKAEKAAFRSTAEWKLFRRRMKRKWHFRDALTHRPLLMDWELHHLDMGSYDDLSDTGKFVPLNRDVHAAVHVLFRAYRHDKAVLGRLKDMLDMMCEYNKC